MALHDLLNYPDAADPRLMASWAFAHMQDHVEIAQKIKQLAGVDLPQYQLYPFNRSDTLAYLFRHQQMHDDFNSVLNLDGVDLSALDFENPEGMATWTNSNFREHQAARAFLSI